jgi:hypothetical protein
MIEKNTHISCEELKERFNYCQDTGIFTVKKVVSGSAKKGEPAGWIDHRCKGYIRIEISNIVYYAHRLAWLHVHGCFPIDEIDHINGVRGDNRICNLRLVSRMENMMNKRRYKNNKSGYIGVVWSKTCRKWIARITFNKKQINLGSFHSLSDAAQARKDAEIKFGYHPNHGNDV